MNRNDEPPSASGRKSRPAFLPQPWKLLLPAVFAAFSLEGDQTRAEYVSIEQISLPPLRIQGQPAKAHTQGMELVAGNCFVTARRDDVRPRQALLLRAAPSAADWDIWDITPLDAQGVLTPLDHPGGMQSDGTRLWIPVAESKRNGRSLVRAYRMAEMKAGQPVKSESEFLVEDHIGAVAVSAGRRLLIGANWDTEKVYLWDFQGRLLKTLAGDDLRARGLGVVAGRGGSGVAVQDWKIVGDRLYASGLFRSSGSAGSLPESRVLWFDAFAEPHFQRWAVKWPLQNGIQLAREAMAISDRLLHWLPEDLGATNRMFRASVADLPKRVLIEESTRADAP